MQALSWNEQCKPVSLGDYDSVHNHIASRLSHIQPFSESMIFCGPPGSGKSTLVTCLMNDWLQKIKETDQKYSVFRVTPDNMNQWTNFAAKFSRNSDYIAVLVFDGVWGIPEQDQQFLSSVIESNRVCVLITTSVISGWSTCLRSQLLEVEMGFPDHDESKKLAINVLNRMNQNMDETTLERVVTKSRGNIFWLLHGLQAASLGCTPEKHGDDDIRERSKCILSCMIERDWNGCRNACITLWETGWSSNEVIHYLYEEIANSTSIDSSVLSTLTEKIASMTVLGWGATGIVKPMDSFVSLIGKVGTLFESL